MDDLFLRALLAGGSAAVLAGPLGSALLWQRMAYFGDSMAHSALLGVIAGLLLGVNVMVGVGVMAVVVALGLVLLQSNKTLSSDTLLGIMAHTALALGVVILSFMTSFRVDLMAYLFGDILAVSRHDILVSWGFTGIILGGLALIWRRLLAVTLSEDIARTEGISVLMVRLGFALLVALAVAVTMRVVGVLLITALLIIPAAAARRFARTPEAMAGLAIGVGIISVIGGLWASFQWDTPAGPSVIIAGSVLFLISQLIPKTQ